VESRDKKITSLATQLKLTGYEDRPFVPGAVKEFLSQVATHRQQREEEARREKVSRGSLPHLCP